MMSLQRYSSKPNEGLASVQLKSWIEGEREKQRDPNVKDKI